MDFREKIEHAKAWQVRVFMSYIFGDAEEDMLQYLASLEAEAAEPFYVIMPRQWYEARWAKYSPVTGEKLQALAEKLNETFETFFSTFTQEEDAKQSKLVSQRDMIRSHFEEGFWYSDQTKGFAMPPVVKTHEVGGVISLPDVSESILKKTSLFSCIQSRKSRRKFSYTSISLEELSFLLWATQTIRREIPGKASFRPVPSAGARHPFETYLAVQRVSSLNPGIYRYLPREHQLIFCHEVDDVKSALFEATLGQQFAADAAVTFIWTAVPYRCEWRYVTEASKLIAQDSGHLCQNLYLAVEALECGACAIGAYSQTKMDVLVRVDGEEEFVVYVAPVGKITVID